MALEILGQMYEFEPNTCKWEQQKLNEANREK